MNITLFTLINHICIYGRAMYFIEWIIQSFNRVFTQFTQLIQNKYRVMLVGIIFLFFLFFCVTEEAFCMNNGSGESSNPSPLSERASLLDSQRSGRRTRRENCCSRMCHGCGRCSEGKCVCAIVAAESAVCGAVSGLTGYIVTEQLESALYWALKVTCTHPPSPTQVGLVGCGAGCAGAAVVSATAMGCMNCYYRNCNNNTEVIGEEQNSESSSNSYIGLQEVVVTQPQSIGTPDLSVITRQPGVEGVGSFYSEGDIFSNFTSEEHIHSLLGMQCALLDISNQMLTSLKVLALKTYECASESEEVLQQEDGGPKIERFQGPLYVFKGPTPSVLIRLNSIQPFITFDRYKTNLEYKVRSGQAGIVIDVVSDVHLGLVYSKYNNDTRTYGGSQYGLGAGAIKVKANTESLSVGIVLNPIKVGFTGYLASCYGWGNVKNTREVTHNRETYSKGSPDINMTGGILQVGYNFPVTKHILFTPYIETIFSVVKWSPYRESTGLIPCAWTKNKEQVVEKSIGLRSNWNITDTSHLQTWIAGVSGRRIAESMSCKPVRSYHSYQVSIPLRQRIYRKIEVGLSYLVGLTDRFNVSINSMMYVENVKKVRGKQTTLFFSYSY